VRRPGIGGIEIAAAKPVVQRDVGVLDALEVLEVRERSGRTQLVVHVDACGERFGFVEDGRQLLIFGRDELHRFLGNVRIDGDDGRDRFADEANLPLGKNRLIVEGRTVIGVRDYLLDVVDGDHVKHARDLLCRADVDRSNAAVRNRAAEQLRRQHSGQTHRMDIFGAAGDFVAALGARERAPDLRAGSRRGVLLKHDRYPRLVSAQAACTARRT
jgi:hypothetical protein